ncbi:MAG: lytic murein transglycosylase [Gemmobacter sp.]
MRPLVPLAALAVALSLAPAAASASCGGPFPAFIAGLKAEALAKGYDKAAVDAFFRTAAQDPAVLRADRGQGVFRMGFTEFARRLISQNRMTAAQTNAARHKAVFDRARRDYGVPPGILLAFWAFETDFGAVQGNFNTLNALVTLAHDCRRPDLFRPQVFAALEMARRGMFDPARTTGAWAGEIGMVQMLPTEIIRRGVDGDGDGRIDLNRSVPDSILTAARKLKELGWRAGEPILVEAVVPADMDWSRSGIDKDFAVSDWAGMGVRPRSGTVPGGLRASLLLPEGRRGPAFLAFPNFKVLFEWNKSFVYVTTAAYFAARIEGAPVFDPGRPETGLGVEDMRALQTKLRARGHDVGAIDGILGALTRAAVQKEQMRLGLPADAWPTPALLSRL